MAVMEREGSSASHVDKVALDRLRARLQAYMAKKGLRSTAQRRLIVDTFFAGAPHMTIEDLLAEVRAHDRGIGYATVYRTLKLLAECGVASERRFGDGLSRYELADDASTHHDHLICVELREDHRVRGAADRGAPGRDRRAVRLRRDLAQARDVRHLRGLPRRKGARPPASRSPPRRGEEPRAGDAPGAQLFASSARAWTTAMTPPSSEAIGAYAGGRSPNRRSTAAPTSAGATAASASPTRASMRVRCASASESAASRTSSEASDHREVAGRRAGGAERDGDVRGAERGVVDARVAEDGDARARVDQAAHLGAAIGGQDLGADVVDVERAADGLARLARVARHQHRLDLRVEQVLHGGARAGAQAVLQAEEADEARAERDEDHGAAERLELGDAALGRGDGDAAARACSARLPTQSSSPEELTAVTPRPGCEVGVAHAVGAEAARARGADDRRRRWGAPRCARRRPRARAPSSCGVELARPVAPRAPRARARRGAACRARRTPRPRRCPRDPRRRRSCRRCRGAARAGCRARRAPRRSRPRSRVASAACTATAVIAISTGAAARDEGGERADRTPRRSPSARRAAREACAMGARASARRRGSSRTRANARSPPAQVHAPTRRPRTTRGAGDDRIAVAAARRRGRADPREHLDVAARDDEVDGDDLARARPRRARRVEIEELILGALGGRRRRRAEGAVSGAGPASTRQAAGAPGRAHACDPRALREHAMAGALDEPRADRAAVTMMPASDAASAAERAILPKRGPDGGHEPADDGREHRRRVRIGGVARASWRRGRGACPAPTAASTIRAPMTSVASAGEGERDGERARDDRDARAGARRRPAPRPHRGARGSSLQDGVPDGLDQRAIVVEDGQVREPLIGRHGRRTRRRSARRDPRRAPRPRRRSPARAPRAGCAGWRRSARRRRAARPTGAPGEERRRRARPRPRGPQAGRPRRRRRFTEEGVAAPRVAEVMEPLIEDRDVPGAQRIDELAAARARDGMRRAGPAAREREPPQPCSRASSASARLDLGQRLVDLAPRSRRAAA